MDVCHLYIINFLTNLHSKKSFFQFYQNVIKIKSGKVPVSDRKSNEIIPEIEPNTDCGCDNKLWENFKNIDGAIYY